MVTWVDPKADTWKLRFGMIDDCYSEAWGGVPAFHRLGAWGWACASNIFGDTVGIFGKMFAVLLQFVLVTFKDTNGEEITLWLFNIAMENPL